MAQLDATYGCRGGFSEKESQGAVQGRSRANTFPYRGLQVCIRFLDLLLFL
jgi:hypothetical protein